ncbi:hypothetical protein ACFYO5_20190 [Streptomyces sp. NPDC006259]|uniref:hypothetical protein n=1 Tax=Streptomyces sp. NPDC006259 TaxID=3364740 RepID=UPI00368B9CB1
MDISDDGQNLDPQWVDVANNVCVVLHGCRNASTVARHFVRAGWGSRSSSWHGYEVETHWCQLEIDPMENSDVLLNGVVDPQRVDELAGVLNRIGMRYSLGLHKEDNTLIREIQAR